jgi:membrane protease YdiL (CAAX protease family)
MQIKLRELVRWGIRDVLTVIGLFFVVSVIASVITVIAVGAPGSDNDNDEALLRAGLIATIAIDAVLLGLAILFSVVKYRTDWGALGFRWPSLGDWWKPFATLLCLWLVLGVYLAIVGLIEIESLEPQSTLEEDVFDTPALVALAGILALIAAPLAEETFFRGFLFAGLRKRLGIVISALASGALFGLVHFDPGSIVPFSLIGAVLALAYAFTGSLWISITAHFLFNFVSFVATLAMQNGG